MKTFLFVLSFLILASLVAQPTDLDKQHFVNRMIDNGKEKAREQNLVLVVIENPRNAILVFFEQEEFKGVRVGADQKKVGLSLLGAEFMLLDKGSSRLQKQKYPERFRSCYATVNGITISQDYLHSERMVTVKSTTEFVERFYQTTISPNKRILLDVQIFNYRPAPSPDEE